MQAYSLDSMFWAASIPVNGSRWKLQLGPRFGILHGLRARVAPAVQRSSCCWNSGSHFFGSSAVTAAHT